MSLGIVVTSRSTATVVAVTGDIDLSTAPQLETVLADLDGDVVVDLSRTEFLDSTALGVFVGTDNRLRPTGHTIAFVCPSPHLRKVFRITRLDELWPVHLDLEAAVPAS